MAALTGSKLVNIVKSNDPEGIIVDLPMGASETIYKGSFVSLDAGDLFGAPLAGGEIFAGIALETKISTSAANGTSTIKIISGTAVFQYAITSIAQADIGKTVYATDDNTLGLADTSGSAVGRIINVPATGTAIIQMRLIGDTMVQAASAV